jgi:repressor LexA
MSRSDDLLKAPEPNANLFSHVDRRTVMPDFSTLTDKQREIYDFIRAKIEKQGFPPTVREIGEAFEIQSPNGVMCHLKALEKKGAINRTGFRARAIELVGYKPGSTSLPLRGKVAAGSPVEAVDTDDKLDFQEMFGGDGHFALRVDGTSMIDDHIADGDYVVIRKQETATNGESVVAMVDGEVTLKRIYTERDHVRLEPANGSMKPIIVPASEMPEILGVLVGVLRKCSR